ncbi:DUF6233 domain-containing protein [Streptomyces sp. LHD-70]|uniref:DUF6233 domain-containing protein n=1 Tax=Streptomyces sp. LHD-70 TaxID=3072140 RepID=UPI00280F979E|nr:DUF6233 domain-containing protein [Streptomyces sp. LHD-70]MDQ8707562.1 DUF6233 domain-containing protein [Streptomyces sp. LHD-70]
MGSEQPPADRLSQLRFLERVQTRDLDRTRRWIADEERRRTERERGKAARPAPPDWLLELGLSGRSAIYVHTGDCHMAGKRIRQITAEQAREALHHGPVPACSHCRPDTALGLTAS